LLGAIDEQSGDLTAVGRQMLRLPMHPRYSRMIVEAARNNCVPAAALCAALVSGRDLLMRLGRDDKHVSEARELFEGSAASDFHTLMRAYQFAKQNAFSPERCRRYGIHAQTARQVEQTFEQIIELARRQNLAPRDPVPVPASADDALLKCIMAGFIDQLCVRRDQGTLECEMTEGRHGTLMRESVVQNAPLFVTSTIREVTGRGSTNLTLLGLATAVKREWIEEMFPQHLATQVEHLYDRTHKRVAAVKLIRFRDLVIHHEHQRDVDPDASGRALAEAFAKGWFELPLLTHDLKQFIARVNLIATASPELEFPAFDRPGLVNALTKAFSGLTLVKEAQAAQLREAVHAHLASEQRGWLDELAPTTIQWGGGKPLKLLYPEEALDEDGVPNSPEIQVKLHEVLQQRDHPSICEGKLPVKIWLCAPDGKRLESTTNWPAFKANTYAKLKHTLAKKYPGFTWL
jgi:ATP-dependent helicase HrpB